MPVPKRIKSSYVTYAEQDYGQCERCGVSTRWPELQLVPGSVDRWECNEKNTKWCRENKAIIEAVYEAKRSVEESRAGVSKNAGREQSDAGSGLQRKRRGRKDS